MITSSGGPIRPLPVIVHPLKVRATVDRSDPTATALTKIVNVDGVAAEAWLAGGCASEMPAHAAIAAARAARRARLE